MIDLLYHSESGDPRIEAALKFVFESLGIVARPAAIADLEGRPHLFHGRSDEARPDGVVVVKRDGGVPLWGPFLHGDPAARPVDGVIRFDVVDAIAALLGDEPHQRIGVDRLDAHGRLGYADSAPATAGFGSRPIVNEYVELIGSTLALRLGVLGRPRWPEGKRAVIALSHDVDAPDRYALLGSAVRPWRLRKQPRSYVRGALALGARWLKDEDRDDFWLFDDVMASEAAFGFRSTFFFSTVPFHSTRGHPLDVQYDVGQRRYRRMLASLQDHGFEVGLHASYRAHEREAWMAEERDSLGRLAGSPIAGIRHHYWHLGPDIPATLRSHEQAGFDYDSSLAFNDAVGFRRSVALPFHPYDPSMRRALRTREIPTFCMDGNLFYTSDDVEAAVSSVDAMVEQIVSVGGVGSIDWHIQTSYPRNREFRAWGEAYQSILERLAARSDVWVDTLGAVNDWVARRERDLRSKATTDGHAEAPPGSLEASEEAFARPLPQAADALVNHV